jgi:cytochrome c biogenesis protein CcdA
LNAHQSSHPPRPPAGAEAREAAIDSAPISIALIAGALAVVNPCGFPLLPAFLSFYLGADEERLPSAPTRALQGLIVGALVAAGFLGLFAVVGLPVSFGVGAFARAVPWAGLATGAVLAALGVFALLGFQLTLPTHLRLRVGRERNLGAMFMFGVGYGLASLGCTLPLLLTLIGASLGGDKITVFLAYGAGMAVVLMALAVLVALLRQEAARSLRLLLPHMHRVAGALLVAAGGYLAYYWARFKFGDTANVADDPVVTFVVRFSGHIRRFADGRGYVILIVAGTIVAAAALSGLRQYRRRATLSS